MRRRLSPIVILFALAVPARALAQITPLNSPAAFSGKETVLVFDNTASGPPVISSYGGVAFRNGPHNGVSLGNDSRPRPFGPQEPTTIDSRGAGNAPIDMTLPGLMTRFALEATYNNCDARASLQFFNGTTLVGSATSPPSQPSNIPDSNPCSKASWVFAGFQSVTPFNRVTVIGPGDSVVTVDNIRFENVTPPPTLTALPNPSAFSGKETLITFEGLGVSGPLVVTSMNGVSFASGSTPNVALGNDPDPRPYGPPDPISVDNRAQPSQPVTLTFSSPMTRVAFESRFNGCAARVTAAFFTGATQIGTLQSPASGTRPDNNCSPGGWLFSGFQSATPFDRVVLTAPVGGYIRVDNLRFERQ